MSIPIPDEEKHLFKRIQSIRNFFRTSSAHSHDHLDYLFIKNILYNRLVTRGIFPPPGEFDALADDIEHYLKTTLDHFIAFYTEKESPEEAS